MEKTSIKFLVDQLLERIQEETVQPNQVFEIVGKLELAKYYLLAKAGRTTVTSGPSSLQKQVAATPLVSTMDMQVTTTNTPALGIVAQPPTKKRQSTE